MLNLRTLRAGYGAIEAVRGISMEVAEGQVVALIGANGAGKSTTLGALSGLVHVFGGSIEFRGETLDGVAAHKRARRGLIQVPEGRWVLGPLTVRENLELGAVASSGRGPGAAQRVSEVFELFPVLSDRHNQLAGLLSGGEQQMLAIGRALMGEPDLLLLDEPSLGLAPIVADAVFASLAHLRELGMTILLVEQNAYRALEMSSYAYILERGLIVTEGASRALLDDADIVSRYLGGAP